MIQCAVFSDAIYGSSGSPWGLREDAEVLPDVDAIQRKNALFTGGCVLPALELECIIVREYSCSVSLRELWDETRSALWE